MTNPRITLITVSDAREERTKFHHSLALSIAAQKNVSIEWLWAMPENENTNLAFSKISSYLDGSEISLNKVETKQGMTVGQRRNLALSRASGEFISGIDDDDVLYSSNVLFNSVSPMMKDKDIHWTASPIYDLVELEFSIWDGQLAKGVYNLDEELLNILTSTPAPVSIHPTTIVSRTSIEKEHGGWDESLSQAEDIVRALRLAKIGHGKMEMISTLGWLYRKHNNSMMADPEILRKDAEIINNVYKEYDIKKPFPQLFE